MTTGLLKPLVEQGRGTRTGDYLDRCTGRLVSPKCRPLKRITSSHIRGYNTHYFIFILSKKETHKHLVVVSSFRCLGNGTVVLLTISDLRLTIKCVGYCLWKQQPILMLHHRVRLLCFLLNWGLETRLCLSVTSRSPVVISNILQAAINLPVTPTTVKTSWPISQYDPIIKNNANNCTCPRLKCLSCAMRHLAMGGPRES